MWEVIELSIYVVLVIIGITQVVIPAFSTKLPFFWLFRKSSVKKLIQAQQTLEDTEIELEADAIRKKARDINYASIMKDIEGMEVKGEGKHGKERGDEEKVTD